MKKPIFFSLCSLWLICGSAFMFSSCEGKDKKHVNNSEKLGKDDLVIKDEEDDTDIYAIPYDDSEPEENLEMQYLEKEGREAQLRREERKSR